MINQQFKNPLKSACLLALTLTLPSFATAQEDPEKFQALKEELPKLQKALEAIRGLPFKMKVKAEPQSDKDFRAYVKKSLSEEYPKEKLAAQSRLLTRLGLLPKGTDFGQAILELFDSQSLAYYDPPKDTFFIVKPDATGKELSAPAIHELQHALQDQHFALDDLRKKAVDLSDDAQHGLNMLVEGEATYVMFIYQLQQQMPGMVNLQNPNLQNALDMQFGMINRLDREALLAMQKRMLQMQEKQPTEEQQKEMAISLKTPRYLYRSMTDPYFKGGAMIHEVFKKGGWKAVDALWSNPPSSSEQALHPEKLIGKRDEPMLITLPDVSAQLGEGWTRVAHNTMGELGLRTVFREVLGENALTACAGWDGDQVETYEPKTGEQTAIVWHTCWDSKKDAREFAIKYKAALVQKYGLATKKSEAGIVVFHKDKEEHLMALSGQDVLIIEGVGKDQARKIMDKVLKESQKVEFKPSPSADKTTDKPDKRPETQRRAH